MHFDICSVDIFQYSSGQVRSSAVFHTYLIRFLKTDFLLVFA